MNFLELSKQLRHCAQNKSWHLLLELLPELLIPMQTTPQDPIFHAEGDVWTHTKMVLDCLVEDHRFIDLDADEQDVLLWAALLHDVAKPATTVIDPETGKISQPGHSARGCVDTRIFLWSIRTPFAKREQICSLISAHQVPFFAFKQIKEKSPEYLVHKLSQYMSCKLLAILATADIKGRVCPGVQEVVQDIELFSELCLDQNCYDKAYSFADEFTRVRYFQGEDVDPAYAYHVVPGSSVTLLCGMPAVGKNTWVAKHGHTENIVSFDDAKAELGLKHGENDGKAAHFAIDKAKVFLRNKEPFIWNSTNLSKQMRSKSISLLLAYHATVRVVYLEQPKSVVLARNQKRDSTLSNKVLEQMLFKWEMPNLTECHYLDTFVET